MRTYLATPILLAICVIAFACGSEGGDSDATKTPVPTLPELPTSTPADGAVEAPCFETGLSAAAAEALPSLTDAPGRIAFVCEGQIWTMRADGSAQIQVTDSTEIDYERVTLYRVPEDQPPTAQEITDLNSRMNSSPAWGPNGEIIFASIRDTLALSAASSLDQRRPFIGANELYTIEQDGTGLSRLTTYNLSPDSYSAGTFEPAKCQTPDFCFAGLVTTTPLAMSSDGAQIAVSIAEIHFSECCFFAALLDRATGTLAVLVPGPDDLGSGSTIGFTWSPGAEQGLLYLWRGNPLGGPYFEELTVRNLISGVDTLIVRAGDDYPLYRLGAPAWSPTDDRIAFCARSESTFEAPYALYITTTSGSEPEALMALEPGSDDLPPVRCEPSWSPDGKFIAFADGEDGIRIVDAETGASAIVARGSQPAWGTGN